jgi:regulator of sigma E protease
MGPDPNHGADRVNNAVIMVLALIVVLGVLVFVHELGHFLAAKWAGIRVFRFALGMGRPIRRLTFVRGDTEYAVCWLPLGGYVKMASQEEMAGDALEGGRVEVEVPAEETFEAKPVWKRMVVILAGVAMNVLFAWLVFSGVVYRTGRPVIPITTVGLVVDSLIPPGAEALRELEPGDRIDRVAGTPVRSWDDIVDGIQHAGLDTIPLEVAGKGTLRLMLHRDAIRERAEASSGAIRYWIHPVIGELVAGRPADRAGLARGDTVLAVDGEPVREWDEVIRHVETRPGESLRLTIGRASGRQEVPVRPEAEWVGEGPARRRVGRIGVWPLAIEPRYEPLSLGQAMVLGGRTTLNMSTLIVRVVRGMLTGRVSTRELGGPLTIAQGAAETARRGAVEFLMFMGLISVNLAVVNLLPIPVLDGGQFLFLLGEAVLRRPLPLRLRQRLTALGLLLVGLLMVLAISNDLLRLFGL